MRRWNSAVTAGSLFAKMSYRQGQWTHFSESEP